MNLVARPVMVGGGGKGREGRKRGTRLIPTWTSQPPHLPQPLFWLFQYFVPIFIYSKYACCVLLEKVTYVQTVYLDIS